VYQAKKYTGNGSDAGNRTDAGKETSCEERIGQLVVKLKDKGIRIKQWRIGAFNRTLCPVVLHPFPLQIIAVVTVLFC
jgi:hypothetical protein